MVWRTSRLLAMVCSVTSIVVGYQGLHDRLLDVEAILSLLVCEATGSIEDSVGHRHLLLVHDEMPVAVTDRLLGFPVAEERQGAPALGVHDVGALVGRVDVVADGHLVPLGHRVSLSLLE